ncbi:LPXTG-site transpeptidase (sortase) family protein [Streptomyces sp. 3213]|uniref:sortase n=1 Tax=Streptomyces sp. 3213.3 TaxID=1855348 RepID=UPI0008953B3F|nr:sortase [Streptomyces sp. 3213.3]SED95194.1 LPXTG-site transpeptidase (sortase) family protein [Streptomyces sp. 3213] [Streptomyces sp. 3213.3]
MTVATPVRPVPAVSRTLVRSVRGGRSVTAVRHLSRGGLLSLAALLLGITAQLLVFSGAQEHSAQHAAFDELRGQLALGTAPVSQTDQQGKLLAPGTPVALIRVPSLGLSQVVLEGTDSTVLTDGPGHRRDTPFPGQSGTSVLMGRAAAYGGPFGRLAELRAGVTFTVTTGQGTARYQVTDVRRAGDPAPAALAAGQGRLVLVTATGPHFMPAGVLRVDADLVSTAFQTPAAVIRSGTLPDSEEPLARPDGVPWPLVMWLQALLLAAVAAVWAWHRWGRHQTWIVFAPLVAVLGLQVATRTTELLPNLL